MISTQDLGDIATHLGATFYGVSDLSTAREAIAEQGGTSVSQYNRAVSIGVALPAKVVDGIVDHNDKVALMSYSHHGYDVVNRRLDAIASRIASRIQGDGGECFPIAASQTIDSNNHLGAFSHKLAARLAGLGWIGKSCLLVTPEVGPRVRWATVLTNALLDPTGSPVESRCGTCTECVDICPASAFSGRPFQEVEPRSVRFDVHKCYRHQRQLHESLGFSLCGLCLYVCPFGQDQKPSASE